MVGSRLYSKQTMPLTNWEHHRVIKWSEACCAANRQGHLHAEGITRSQNGQAGCTANRQGHLHAKGITRPQNDQKQVVLQTNKDTYMLRPSQGQKIVRSSLCSKQTMPLTNWEHHRAIKWSEAGCAANRQGHLQAEGITWPQNGQNQVVQQIDKATYPLRAS